MTRVAINGFGRIGRSFLRMAFDHADFEIVAINDLGDLENLAYLLQYDSAYGQAPFEVKVIDGNTLEVSGKKIAFSQEREPAKLPWAQHNVDLVLEATGVFTKYATAKQHMQAGAKRVVISAPAKDDPAAAGVNGATVLMGVNHDQLKTCDISSNASCTTNATSPLIAILEETVGVEKAMLSTVHAYTATQSIVDSPNKKDFRKGRAAAFNIIPSTTGAAIATTEAHPKLTNKFDGMAFRVPVPVGSVVDITCVTSRDTTVEEINSSFQKAAHDDRWKGIFSATDEPIVSTDIVGSRVGSIADLSFTRVVDGNLVKVLGWYDNETSYTQTLIEHVAASGKHIAAA